MSGSQNTLLKYTLCEAGGILQQAHSSSAVTDVVGMQRLCI